MIDKLVYRSLDWIESKRFDLGSPVPELWNRLQSITRVQRSDEVDTAWMRNENNQPVIEFNSDFVENEICDGENSIVNMSLVLLHEAFHGWRGDLYFSHRPLSDSIWNLICDLVIHRELFAAGFPRGETLTRERYGIDEINALLIPPHHLIEKLAGSGPKNRAPDWRYEPVDSGSRRFKFLLTWFQDELEPIWRPNLPWLDDADPSLTRLVRTYLKAWTGGMGLSILYQELLEILEIRSTVEVASLGSHGRGQGNANNREDPAEKRNALHQSRFVKILRQALIQTKSSKSKVRRRRKSRGVIPSTARRSTFLLAGGSWPVFFEREIHKQARQQKGAHIYLDSSGSIRRDFVDLVSALLVGCAELVARPVHLFGDTVEDVSIDRLKSGYRITGGTRIEPVIKHAKKRRLSKFIVITDGAVESISNRKYKNYLQKASMLVLFTQNEAAPLDEFAEKTWANVKAKLTAGKGV